MNSLRGYFNNSFKSGREIFNLECKRNEIIMISVKKVQGYLHKRFETWMVLKLNKVNSITELNNKASMYTNYIYTLNITNDANCFINEAVDRRNTSGVSPPWSAGVFFHNQLVQPRREYLPYQGLPKWRIHYFAVPRESLSCLLHPCLLSWPRSVHLFSQV